MGARHRSNRQYTSLECTFLLLACGVLSVRAQWVQKEEIAPQGSPAVEPVLCLLQRPMTTVSVEKTLSTIEAEEGSLHLLDPDAQVHGPAAEAGSGPQAGPRHDWDDKKPKVGAINSGRVLVLYLGGGTVLAVAIAVLFRSRGAAVVTMVIVYVAALSTIQLSVKLVQDVDHFPYPVFLTLCHFVSSGLVAMVALPFAQSSIRWPTVKNLSSFFAPIALCQAISTGCANMSLLYSSAGFVEIVGNTTPIMTVGVMICMGQYFRKELLVPLAVLLTGLILTSTGDLHFKALGLILALVATLGRSLKAVLQHMLLRESEDAERHTPLEVLAWVSIPLSLIMAVWFLCKEGKEPVERLARARPPLIGAILLSCGNAIILNFAQLCCIKEIGAVGSQVIAPAKTMLVVLGGVALLGETVTRYQGLGMGLVMVGVWFYNRLDLSLDQREAKAVKAEHVETGDEQATTEETASTCSTISDTPEAGSRPSSAPAAVPKLAHIDEVPSLVRQLSPQTLSSNYYSPPSNTRMEVES